MKSAASAAASASGAAADWADDAASCGEARCVLGARGLFRHINTHPLLSRHIRVRTAKIKRGGRTGIGTRINQLQPPSSLLTTLAV